MSSCKTTSLPSTAPAEGKALSLSTAQQINSWQREQGVPRPDGYPTIEHIEDVAQNNSPTTTQPTNDYFVLSHADSTPNPPPIPLSLPKIDNTIQPFPTDDTTTGTGKRHKDLGPFKQSKEEYYFWLRVHSRMRLETLKPGWRSPRSVSGSRSASASRVDSGGGAEAEQSKEKTERKDSKMAVEESEEEEGEIKEGREQGERERIADSCAIGALLD